MGIMSTGGRANFARLLAATPTAGEAFQERVTAVLPDDKAVAAFAPTFRALADHDRLNLLLHHGAAGIHDRAQLAAFDWVAVRTLAANGSQSITVRDDGDTVWLWPSLTSSHSQGGAARVARVIETVSSEEATLAVYLVDAVLVPGNLRQKDGGYFDWLHCCVPLWAVLGWVVAAIGGFLVDWVAPGYRKQMQ